MSPTRATEVVLAAAFNLRVLHSRPRRRLSFYPSARFCFVGCALQDKKEDRLERTPLQSCLVGQFMKVNPKTLVSKTEVNRLRKQRQVRAKKQAKLLKQFRRVKEDTKADKIHQDLVNALHHVQRINKKFKDTILTDFSEQDKTFEKIIQSLLRQVNTLTESSLQILDRTVPLEISEHIAHKNLHVNRERNYL
ncbi:hypothetical protein AC1031_009455 [Aphanomyces cochlioides]|nr:hypothetical protein AC1031_009455 [Aphanomyces cochlioides]